MCYKKKESSNIFSFNTFLGAPTFLEFLEFLEFFLRERGRADDLLGLVEGRRLQLGHGADPVGRDGQDVVARLRLLNPEQRVHHGTLVADELSTPKRAEKKKKIKLILEK